ncbi:hypothetical protein DRO03_10285 [Methanosarcinales archaeon]|nr:MAG: hypothetical protein DRO03_10285 [Methanosarcinales archaeon]
MITVNGKHKVNAELAKELLDTWDNSLNRQVISSKVDKYATDMLTGAWHYNGDSIRVTTSGKLVDGQHRLMAIMVNDTPQDLYFILDLEEEVAEGVAIFEVIDQATRKPYEVLKVAHKEVLYPQQVVNLMKKLSLFNDCNILAPQPRLGNKDVLEFAEHHQPLKRLDDAVERGLLLSKRGDTILDKNDSALLAITLGTCDKGNEFLETLASLTVFEGTVYNKGHEVELTDPIANLSKVLKAMKLSKLKGANEFKAKMKQIFKAYDLYLNDEKVAEGYVYGGKDIVYPTDYQFYTL